MTNSKRNGFIPSKKMLNRIIGSFSARQNIVFIILILVMTVSAISVIGKINSKFMTSVPEDGGRFSEGVLGTPRFINPVIALGDTDKDLSSLIYSGLMKKSPDGKLALDLAESYEVSSDGLTYTFKIKPDAQFHDKTPLTAYDIVFTVEKIKDSLVKSPLQASWEGITATAPDAETVAFRLSRTYTSFLENTTLGILPKHIWEKYDSEEFNFTDSNLNAIGAGPYYIRKVVQKKNGLVEEIKLSVFGHYAGTKPFIQKINFKFYKNEDELIHAYKKGRVDQISSISPNSARELETGGYKPTVATLSRIFGLFFNPNHNDVLRNKSVAEAIDLGIDKEEIVKKVLYGFGEVLDGPVPRSLSQDDTRVSVITKEDRLAKASGLLDKAGYTMNQDTGFRERGGAILEFSISTADVLELRQTAEIIKSNLSELGIKVDIKVFEIGILNQNVIRPREYEALLFGQVVRNDSDLLAFWHSSQRNDPGLNIAVYTNSRTDKILEDLVASVPETDRLAKLAQFEALVKEDSPAVFLYSPQFIYMKSPKIKNIKLDRITTSSERFLGISDWYIRTDNVWTFWPKEPIFKKSKN